MSESAFETVFNEIVSKPDIMSFEEISRSAGRNEPLPEGLSESGTMLFEGLRYLYMSYQKGYISKDETLKEKRRLQQAYRDNVFKERLWRHQARRYQMLLKLEPKAHDEGCEHCHRMLNVLSGLEDV